jgi:hypothetical protein
MTSLLKRSNQKHYEEQNAKHCFAKKKQNENLSIAL